MERFIADLVKAFEAGSLSRREFCQTVALAATVYAAGDAANAEPGHGFKVLGINHISYACPDYTKARDWYTSVLGMVSTPGKDTGKRADLMFGPPPGQGGSYLVTRNTDADVLPTPKDAVVDHICFTIPDWDETRVRAALTANGLQIGGRNGSLHVYDPFGFDVQLANAVEENAFRHGA
jgi:catechol 2,3-dioxygenase-like lactoylglutathione lyase family enzyme